MIFAFYIIFMFSELKKLVKHSGIYAIGAIVQASLSFLLIPFYTRYLSQADYGRLEILQTFLKVLLFLIPLGLPSAILKCYHRDAKSQGERKILMSTAFFLILLAGIVETIILLFFVHPLGQFLIKTNFTLLIYIVLFTSFFAALLELELSFLRAEERSRFYTVVFLLRFILTLGVTIYLVVGLKWGLFGALLGNLAAQILTFLTFLPYLKNYVRISYSKRALTKLLSFGVAILPASIAMWVMDLSDRYFLSHFGSLEEVGVYSVGYRIGFILEFVLVTPFQLAWPPFSFRIAKKINHKQIYARTLTYFFFIGIFSFLFLSFFAPEIIRIIAPENYAKGALIVPLVALAYVFYGMHFVIAPGIHLRGKTKYYPLLIIFPAALNLLLNYLLIPIYGMWGAAESTFIAFIFVFILTYFVSNHFYPVRYEWKRLLKIVISALVIFAFSVFYSLHLVTVAAILIKIGLLILFLILLWGEGFFEKEEKDKIKGVIKKALNYFN